MQKLSDGVYAISYEEDRKPYNSSDEKGWYWNHPYFKDKVVVVARITTRPEKKWPPSDERKRSGREPYPDRLEPSNNQMIGYCHLNNGILLGAGVIKNHATWEEIEKFEYDDEIAAEFESMLTALTAFEKAMSAGFADIYVWAYGRLIDKYD